MSSGETVQLGQRLERLADRWTRLAETSHQAHAEILNACAAELASALSEDEQPTVEWRCDHCGGPSRGPGSHATCASRAAFLEEDRMARGGRHG